MKYDEYLEVRKTNAKEFISRVLINIGDTEDIEAVLEQTLSDYEDFMESKVMDLYKSVGMKPERYQLERMIPRIKDSSIKKTIQKIYFELEILHEAVREFTQGDRDFERTPISFEEAMSKIPDESKDKVISMVQKYVKQYGENPIYVGRGGSCSVFRVGDKIIKFGSTRRYDSIPYCLDIHDRVQYDEYQSVYVTDVVKTFDCPEEVCQKMYNALRAAGFVWVDVKPDNIGLLNGELKILDDVDIFSLEDAMKYNKASVLDFVSNSMRVSLLELNWLRSRIPNFDLSIVDKLFNNESPQTLDFIDRLKSEYLKLNADYEYYPNQNYYVLFCNMLKGNIDKLNMGDSYQNKANKM